jgi:hypothetical protein
MFGPPPVCPFKPLLVECQFLMVFPQFGWGRVDSFSGVPSRVLCSSLSLSLSLSLSQENCLVNFEIIFFCGLLSSSFGFSQSVFIFKWNSLVQ